MAIKRLRYFDNQFLVEADFTDEQKYHLDMRRRLNRALHTFGIAEGLEVVKKTNKIVTVRPGFAIDNLGREMVIEAAQDIDLSGVVTPAPQIFITIAYAEQPTDLSTATGASGNTRFTEQPFLQAVVTSETSENPPPTDGSVVLLATFLMLGGNVPGNINEAIDGGVRKPVGPAGDRGPASIDGVISPGGDIDLVPGAGIAITPDQANRRITIASSGAQALVSLDNVSNPGGNIDLVPSGAITIAPDDPNNRITIGENHSTQIGNVHGLTATNLQSIGALLASQYDLRQRAQATLTLSQFPPPNPVLAAGPRTVNVPFQPRFVLALGSINATLSGRQYGGLTTGVFETATGFQQGQQVRITLSSSTTDWIVFGSLFGGLCSGNFFDVNTINPRPTETLSLSITGTSPTSITLQFDRTVPGGSVALTSFVMTLFMLVMG
jgi:hypothetical protein